MILERGMLLIGDGRLSSAVEKGGELNFYIDRDGAIEKRVLTVGRRGVRLDSEFNSYACDFATVGDIAVEKFLGEVSIRKAK